MNISRLFVLRPVATTLTMIAILLAGLIAYRMLPVSALPQVDYPTIRVMSLYPGASPEVMTSAVTAPLERQFGQMPGLTQMSSTSSGGASVITLRFSLDVELDVAEQEVQAAPRPLAASIPTRASGRLGSQPATTSPAPTTPGLPSTTRDCGSTSTASAASPPRTDNHLRREDLPTGPACIGKPGHPTINQQSKTLPRAAPRSPSRRESPAGRRQSQEELCDVSAHCEARGRRRRSS